jgi:hypothetical protein
MCVVFTDSRSPDCARLAREVFRDPWCAHRISGRYVCARLLPHRTPPSENSLMADRAMALYRVRVLPTLLFLWPDGSVGLRIEGYPGRRALMRAVVDWEEHAQPPRGSAPTAAAGGR